MNNTGNIYFSVLFVILACSLFVIGTSLSIHQVNQKKVWKSTKAWEAFWLGKMRLDHWKIGASQDQETGEGFTIHEEEYPVSEGVLVRKVTISWKEGKLSNGISLSAYKPVIP